MQQKAATLVAAYFNLTPRDHFMAAGAKAPGIKGGPFAERVRGAQNIQAIFRGEMLLHIFMKDLRASPRNRSRR